MRVIISYDISDDKRRRNVVKVLEGIGFRVQYSVFEAELSVQQYRALKQRLRPFIAPKTTDSIRYYRLTADCADLIEVVGTDLSQTLGGLHII